MAVGAGGSVDQERSSLKQKQVEALLQLGCEVSPIGSRLGDLYLW